MKELKKTKCIQGLSKDEVMNLAIINGINTKEDKPKNKTRLKRDLKQIGISTKNLDIFELRKLAKKEGVNTMIKKNRRKDDICKEMIEKRVMEPEFSGRMIVRDIATGEEIKSMNTMIMPLVVARKK